MTFNHVKCLTLFYSIALQPTGNKLSTWTALTTSACGTKEVGGELKDCKTKVNSQFDLVPLFTVAKGKQAVNCAPYSHSHPDKLKPTPVKSQAEAQQKCAADKTCKFYMYIESDAAAAPADDRGKVAPLLCLSLLVLV